MQTRRQILMHCARGGSLLALGAMVVRLGSRSTDANCVRNHPCGACPLFAGCELPKAVENRPPVRVQPSPPPL